METTDKKQQLILNLLEQVRDSDEEVFSYAVPTIFSKRLASFAMIREDILFSKSAFERLLHSKAQAEQDTIIISSLYYAAIIQFGRCFNENKGRHSKLEPSDIFTEQDLTFSQTHTELMDLRKSFVAHRDDNEYEQAVVIMQIPKESAEEKRVEFKVKSLKTISPSIEKLQSYIDLCDFLIPKIDDKIQKFGDKTYDSLFKNLNRSILTYCELNKTAGNMRFGVMAARRTSHLHLYFFSSNSSVTSIVQQ